MKKSLLLIIILTLLSNFLFAQTWIWAKHYGSANTDAGGPTCFDTGGNIYSSGNFFMPQGIFGNDTISARGINDIYVLKLDNNGNIIWVKSAGGNNSSYSESCSDIIFDQSTNSILLVGRMDGSNQLVDTCQVGNGLKIFVTKLDLNGNCLWSISQGLNSNSIGTKICTDDNGNIYMYGLLQYTSLFNGNMLPAGGFIAKFNSSDGACEWVKNIFNTSNLPNSIVYLNNSIYLSGICLDTIRIDTAIAIGNYYDVFLSKFDTSGNVQWVKTVGGPHEDYGGAISLDTDGNIYLTGTFKDTIYFDTLMLTNGINRDWYISKFDNSGNIIWVEQIHADSASGSSNSIDSNGNIYVSGSFSGNAQFGNYPLPSSENGDLFAAKYDSSGNCLGVFQVSNAQYARIACDFNNDFYVCGGFTDTANFDGNTIISYGATDVFIAKHDAISGDPEQRKANNTLTIYANPTAGKCNITVPDDFAHEKNLTLSIYDNTGKLIQQKTLEMNEGKIKLNLEAEAKGVYNVTLSNGKKSYGGKIIFE